MKENDNRLQAYKRTSLIKNVAPETNSTAGTNTARTAPANSLAVSNSERTAQAANTAHTASVQNPPVDARSSRAASEQKTVYDKSASAPIDELTGRHGLIRVTAGQDTMYRRVAKFLLLIGVDEAAKILPHLTPEQTEKIIPEIASIRSVDPDEAAVILAEFENLVQNSRQSGGVNTARSILERAFGPQKAQEMIQKTVPYPEGKPFDYLQDMDGERLLVLLKDESVPAAALVLSRLKPAKAADVINRMDIQQKNDIIRRLASMKTIPTDVIKRVDAAMQEKVRSVQTESSDKVDGRSALAQILRRMSPGAEKEILTSLAENDPDLGSDIKKRLFTMDDLAAADDRFIRTLLSSMTDHDIAVLIAGKNELLRAKIFSNISKGRGAIVLEEEQIIKPVSVRESEEITASFFSRVRRAWENGELVLNGRDTDIVL